MASMSSASFLDPMCELPKNAALPANAIGFTKGMGWSGSPTEMNFPFTSSVLVRYDPIFSFSTLKEEGLHMGRDTHEMNCVSGKFSATSRVEMMRSNFLLYSSCQFSPSVLTM